MFVLLVRGRGQMGFQETMLIPEALDLIINRIAQNYKDDWLIFDDPGLINQREFHENFEIQKKFGAIMDLHSHSFTELYICLEGSGGLLLNNRIYEVKTGDIALILPERMHQELPAQNCRYAAVWMSIDIKRVTLHIIEINPENEISIRTGHSLFSEHSYSIMIKNISAELSSGWLYTMDYVKSHILQLLINAARNITAKPDGGMRNKSWRENIAIETENFINDNISFPIRLDDISKEVCISPNHLNTIFKSVTGTTIMQHVQNCKINKAKELLVSTIDPVAVIASKLGFYDPYHFAKSFKKETGISPMQYRKNIE
jgi:AraC family transcriptional regulator, arabinose operon regulatory protein